MNEVLDIEAPAETVPEMFRDAPRAVEFNKLRKRLVRLTRDTPLDDGLALERTLFLDLLVSDEGFALMSKMNDENPRVEMGLE